MVLAVTQNDGHIRLKEHMFVKVRKAVKLWRFGKRAVSDVEFDRRERNTVIFGDDDFQSIREDAVADELLELGALRIESNRRKDGHRTCGESNRDPR